MSAAARARDRATLEAFAGPHVTIPIALIRRLGGDLDAAAFLQLAAFLSSIVKKKDGFFFLPQDDSRAPNKDDAPSIFVELKSFRAALGLSPEAQLAARKKLKRLGLLQEELRGIPAQLHYRVDASALLDFLAEEDAAPPVPAKAGTRTRKSGNKNPQKREQESAKPGAKEEEEEDKERFLHACNARERAQPAAGGGGAVQVQQKKNVGGEGKARAPQMCHGVPGWSARDLETVSQLVSQHGAPAVEQSAKKIAEAGATPFPSVVLNTLSKGLKNGKTGCNHSTNENHLQYGDDPIAAAAARSRARRAAAAGA